MEKYDVIIIGGGPAGLMAAGRAAQSGAQTLLLEKKRKPGLKLGITGKGRCNITNVAPIPDFISHFGKNGRFLWQIFSMFFTDDLIKFFHSIGIPTKNERGGRVFPESDKATDVVKALISWVKKQNVITKCDHEIQSLLMDKNKVTGVKVINNKKSEEVFYGHSVIIATGGVSYPVTGSTGDGYKLAETAGHSIVPIRPALVPLNTVEKIPPVMVDLNLRNISVTLWIDGKKKIDCFGEMQFMEFGISGPVILSFSKLVVDALNKKQEVFITIDLKPALERQKLEARLLRDMEQQGKSNFYHILKGLLPSALHDYCLEKVGISYDKKGSQVSAKERKRLLNWLKEVKFNISGYRPFEEAIITAGGIKVKEIDPRSLESKKIKGLYFAGEVIDLDADTGGYNLQAAFSTGWVAGKSAAYKKK